MTTDLFETPELIPTDVAAEIDRWEDEFTNGDPYVACQGLLRAVSRLGYTFEYGLDGQPYDLEKISG